LLALPGVGHYTAGALMSIAFQKPYPAIDGNARRVLYRLLNPKNDKELRRFASLLVPRARPGYFNQGLMELGATICIPKNPDCFRCPVAHHCAARSKGQRIENFRIVKSGPTKDIEWPLAIVRQERKILLRQRSDKGLLAGLWEFPGGEKPSRHSQRSLLASQLAEVSARFRRERRIGEFCHSITNRKIRSPVFLFELPNNPKLRLPNHRWRWLSLSSISDFPVSSMTLKAAQILKLHEKNSA
jgi:A/G-specific adenine glycosylase